MSEFDPTETTAEANARMLRETQDEIGHGYCQPNDFSHVDVVELRRLASVAWFRIEARELDSMIAEFNRRNSLPIPPTESYDGLYRWLQGQRSRYPIWFGQPVPAISVFWAYGKHALTIKDFENASDRILLEREKYISGSDEFAYGIHDGVQPYSEREPYRG